MDARLGPPRALYFSSVDPGLDVPEHVRAGSSVRAWRGQLVVVQDDVHALALIDGTTGVARPLLLPPGSDGARSFSERRGNKAAKMDLEASVVLPDGRLVVFGSGSTSARERIVVVDRTHDVRVVDGHALYARLRGHPELAGFELNVEGAVVVGGRLRLFQRGNGAPVGGRAPANAVVDSELEAFVRFLDGAGDAPPLLTFERVELGSVAGVPFGFTDAAALPDGRVLFLAAAEDSPDTFHDGPVRGMRVGLLDGARVVAVADVLDPSGAPTTVKLEGGELVAIDADGALELLVVADLDDPDAPAALLTLRWNPGGA